MTAGRDSHAAYDVVIAGYGGAGAAAAIAAHDAGARVLLLEKSPAGGGSTAESGGSFAAVLDRDGAIEHYLAITEGRTPRDVIAAYVDGAGSWTSRRSNTTRPATSPSRCPSGIRRSRAGTPARLSGTDRIPPRSVSVTGSGGTACPTAERRCGTCCARTSNAAALRSGWRCR